MAVHKFTRRLEFKQYDAILTIEQSVLLNKKRSFEGKNRQT